MTNAINWPLWAATMVPLIFSAGPGNVMVAAAGAERGLKGALSFIGGPDGTYLVLAITIGLGLGSQLDAHPRIAQAVGLLGAVYVLWLALGFFRRRELRSVGANLAFGLREGAIVQITNGKGLLMLVVMFSKFAKDGTIGQVLALSFALIVLNLLSHVLWGAVGGAIRARLLRDPRLFRAQNALFGTMLAGVALWLLLR